MTAKQEQPASLMGTLQSEVATEASPLLRFLVNNARAIAILFVLFIGAIIGFWVYSAQADKGHKADVLALGEILVIPDHKDRLTKLESFAASSTGAVNHSAWLGILSTAMQLKEQDKIYAAWKQIASYDATVRATAAMGMATALAEQGKYAEAVAELERALPGLNTADAANVNVRIGYLAELAGDYPRVLAAADAIMANPGQFTNVDYWKQKKILLARTLEQGAADTSTKKPE